MSTIYLGIGTNIGNRESNLRKALDSLAQRMTLGKISSIYETEPAGYREQPWFLNLVCCGDTEISPFEFLSFAKGIETQMGRKRSFRDAPRVIDIDILFYDERVIQSDELIVPHPRIAERGFVLVPLVEIAPFLKHPENNKTMKDMLSELPDSLQVRKWENVSSISSAAL